MGFVFFNFIKAINNTIIAYGIINIKYSLIKKLTFNFLENCFNRVEKSSFENNLSSNS